MSQPNRTGRKGGAPAARRSAPPERRAPDKAAEVGMTLRIPSTFHAEGSVRAETMIEAERTVEIIFAAGAKVRRYSWDDGWYMEELGMEPENIRLDRFASGMSLLDSHDTYSMDARLGTVLPDSVRIEGGIAYCTVKISRNAKGEALWQDLVDGHPFPVSVGYRTHAYEKIEGDDGAIPILRAIDWEPHEVSAVPVPADGGAHSRSEERNLHPIDVSIRTRLAQEETAMAQRNKTGQKPGEENNPGQADGGADDDAGGDDNADDDAGGEGEGERNLPNSQPTPPAGGGTRSQQPAPTAPAADTVIPQAQIDDAVRRGIEADRSRTAQIGAIAARSGLPAEFTQRHLSSGTAVESFRALAFDEMVRIQEETGAFPIVETRGLRDSKVTQRSAIENALLHANGVTEELKPEAREWRGMSVMDIAKEVLRSEGTSIRGNAHEIAKRAFHTTSDFPTILGNVTDTTLMAGYDTVRAENTFALFATRNTLPDFRSASQFELGSAPDLLPVNEHGEFRRGTMKEGGESFALGTFGRIIGFTRQMLINDQLGAFMRAVNTWGGKVAKLEGDVVWNVILNNMKLRDGVGIFDASRGNVATTGSALTIASVLEGRKAMRKFKDIDGEQIAIKPTYLFVGTENEVIAQQMVAAQYAPVIGQEVTPVVIKSLIPVYEPRLDLVSDYAWFLFATAAEAAGRGVQYAYLAGQETPFTDNRVGFDVDGMEFKIRHDFGAGVTDHRFGYKNAGAAPTP